MPFISDMGPNVGGRIAVATNVSASGDVWYVDSSGGSDAASPAGLNPYRPLATLAQAVSNAASGDSIILRQAHSETISSAVAIGSKILFISGEGSSNGVPSATLTMGHASNDMITASAFGIIQNVRFVPHTSSFSGQYIALSSCDGYVVDGCRFEFNNYNTGYGVHYAGTTTNGHVRDCTFVSTISDSSTAPPDEAALYVESTTSFSIDNTTFDGGSSGFKQPALYAGSSAFVRVHELSLLRGARADLSGNTTYSIGTSSAGGKVLDDFGTKWVGGFGGSFGWSGLDQVRTPAVNSQLFFVDSATGSDSSGYGLERSKPFASLVYAVSQATTSTAIVLMDGHAETISSNLNITTSHNGIMVLGDAQSSGSPSAVITCGVDSGTSVTVAGNGVLFQNIKFTVDSDSTDASPLSVTGLNFVMLDCEVELGDGSNGMTIGTSTADTVRMERCKFTSIASQTASTGPQAIVLTGSTSVWVEMRDCVFDAGSLYEPTSDLGFTAIDVVSNTNVLALGISLLNGADADLIGGKYFFQVSTPSGGAGIGSEAS